MLAITLNTRCFGIWIVKLLSYRITLLSPSLYPSTIKIYISPIHQHTTINLCSFKYLIWINYILYVICRCFIRPALLTDLNNDGPLGINYLVKGQFCHLKKMCWHCGSYVVNQFHSTMWLHFQQLGWPPPFL